MTDTPNRADDCQKILDNGHTIVLFRSGMGSYTAAVITASRFSIEDLPESSITDGFTPSKALYRLSEKFTTGRTA